MDATLVISIAILIGLLWLHRCLVESAYAAGRADEQADKDRRERHGLAALPEEPTT